MLLETIIETQVGPGRQIAQVMLMGLVPGRSTGLVAPWQER